MAGASYTGGVSLNRRRRFALLLLALWLIQRDSAQAQDVRAKNLLANGDIEEGKGLLPADWTFVGSDRKDWTPEEIRQFHLNGRPEFSMGRARGLWSRPLASR